MEGGLPMLNCLLQHTLRSLCLCSDSSASSKWVYAVFWRILPRNYPPPKWDHGGGALDRVKGNKRNWILVWEDGFCDFCECEQAGSGCIKGRFGADVFFKMSHEVYNYGEGLVGKVAADNSHKWVFRDSPDENDPSFISSWNVSIDPQPRAWEVQFNSGIQTISMISVREGIIQLGSFHKIAEDLNLVINVQRKFSYLQSLPGVYAIQRPYFPIQPHPFNFKPNNPHAMVESSETEAFSMDRKHQTSGSKRHCYSNNNSSERNDGESPLKSIYLGYNSPQHGVAGSPTVWSMAIPPLLPPFSCSFGALLSKLPSVVPSYDALEEVLDATFYSSRKTTGQTLKADDDFCGLNVRVHDMKFKPSCLLEANEVDKANCLNLNMGLEDRAMVELGFQLPSEDDNSLNPN